MRPRLRFLLIPALILLLLAATILALCIGPLALINPLTLLGSALGWQPPLPDFLLPVLLQIRLPRLLMAILIGAALAVAGAAMQGLFRNPLADPGLIGVSAGAALAATLWLALKPALPALALLPPQAVLPLAAFIGGSLAALAALRLGQREGHTSVATLLLAGLAINAVTLAAIGLLQQLTDDATLRDITRWMLGSLGKAGWPEIIVAAPLLLAPVLLLPREARALDALLLGEAEAAHLGVDVERLKMRVLLLAVLAVGASVALAGMIGFIGLLAPHLLRLLAGPSHRLLLPASALLGASLLLLADTAARSVAAPLELPVGALTALIGGPFFLWLLARYRLRMELL
ncbi:MAG: iron ABC transporter permease [Stagnimonas sp.]|nr:iron ABC transporter permease [Stagnimonas sp.]